MNRSHRTLETIVRNAAWGGLGLFLGAPLNFAVTILLARGLGTHEFGAFEVIFAYVSVIQILAEGGMSTVLIRRMATDPDSASRYLGEVKSLTWILTLVAFGGGALFSVARVPTHYLPASLILLLATLVTVHAVVRASMFRALEVMGWNAAGFVLQKLVNVLLLGVLVWCLGWGILGAAISLLVANLGLLTYYTVALRRHRLPDPRPVWAPAAWWNLLRESVGIGLGRALRRMTWQVDSLLLPVLAGVTATGMYRAAYRPIFFMKWIPFVVAIPLFPHFSRLAETDRGRLEATYARAIRLMATVSLPAAACLTALAEPLILLVYGEPYRAAVPAFQILIWSVNFLFLTSIFQHLFTALRATRYYVYVTSLGLAVNLVLDLLLIPLMGVVGACWATLAAEAVMFVAGWAGLRLLAFRVPLLPGAALPLLLSAALGWALWGLREQPLPWLVAAVTASVPLYLAALRWTGAMDAEEIRGLWLAIRKSGGARGASTAGEGDREVGGADAETPGFAAG